MADSTISKIKNYLWPKDPQGKAGRKKQYKAIAFFVVSTAVLVKFGRAVADQIYNHSMLEDSIRASLN